MSGRDEIFAFELSQENEQQNHNNNGMTSPTDSPRGKRAGSTSSILSETLSDDEHAILVGSSERPSLELPSHQRVYLLLEQKEREAALAASKCNALQFCHSLNLRNGQNSTGQQRTFITRKQSADRRGVCAVRLSFV